MNVVIMAGGQGTRLKDITGDLPKPMVPICGTPILEHQINNFKNFGIKDFTLIISKNGQAIKDYFKDGKDFGINVSYIVEEIPLGTAGALYYLKNLKEDFILVFGDLLFDLDWSKFILFHKQKDALITLFAHPNSHPFDSDLIVKNEEDRLIKIDSKHNIRDYYYENLVNAGLYIINPKALDNIKEEKKIDFEKDFLTSLIDTNKIYCYHTSEYCKDAGTPDRYYQVTKDYKDGTIKAKNLSNLQKCIFLDRDGVINEYRGIVNKIDDFVLLPQVEEAIKLINNSKYLAIIVSNQPVIARGELSFEGLHNIHNKMETFLGKNGAYLDAIYFCPHHPDKGFEGEVKELKIDCECRKPKSGMLLKAKEKFNIDFSKSYMIGDTSFDFETGKRLNIPTIKVTCGAKEEKPKYDALPTYTKSNLLEAVKYILEKGE